MAEVTLDEVLESVKALTRNERRKLWEVLDTSLESARPTPIDDQLQHKLLAAGLLSEIRPPVADSESYRRYQPVAVSGKPVSETLIEERR